MRNEFDFFLIIVVVQFFLLLRIFLGFSFRNCEPPKCLKMGTQCQVGNSFQTRNICQSAISICSRHPRKKLSVFGTFLFRGSGPPKYFSQARAGNWHPFQRKIGLEIFGFKGACCSILFRCLVDSGVFNIFLIHQHPTSVSDSCGE